jgi:hypothetical protein
MNEITSALRIVNTAMKTVRVMDITKKVVVTAAVLGCCVFAVKYWRK